jgi:hypothetical protein
MKKLKVENFYYNGIFVSPEKGYASYTATFEKWTNDPGVALFLCSDGKERLIPTCQLFDENDEHIKSEEEFGAQPKGDDYRGMDNAERKNDLSLVFGQPCSS